MKKKEKWMKYEMMNSEFKEVGFYMYENKMEEYREVLKRMSVKRWDDF